MREDAILTMPAGREMDALIAEKVMRLKMEGSHHYWMNGAGAVASIPRYSTDIAAAWDVVEKLCDETGCDIVKVCKRDSELGRGYWSCIFGQGHESFGNTAPEAICRAALLAVNE
jgi:hypothetical protein